MEPKHIQTCSTGKQAFKTQNEAWASVRGMVRRKGQKVVGQVYLCRRCRQYHYSRMPKSTTDAKRRHA